MNLLCTKRSTPSIADDYATSDDFRELFTEDMTALHLLAYLLTGSHEKAEQCFVAGLEDCISNNFVFKEWAHSWARRTIVQNAIRMLSPRPNHAAWTRVSPDPAAQLQGTLAKHAAIATVLALGDFERFVFVLSVLERCGSLIHIRMTFAFTTPRRFNRRTGDCRNDPPVFYGMVGMDGPITSY